MTKTKFDSSIGRSQFPKVDLRRGNEIVSFLFQGMYLRIRLRADKANLTKHAFGTGCAKGGPMWRLMRKEGEFLKEKNIDSPSKSKRRILKETEGGSRIHRLGRSTEPKDRSSGTLFKNAIRELQEKSHRHVGDAEAEEESKWLDSDVSFSEDSGEKRRAFPAM